MGGVWERGHVFEGTRAKRVQLVCERVKNPHHFPRQWKSSLNARSRETKQRITQVEFGDPTTCFLQVSMHIVQNRRLGTGLGGGFERSKR